MDLGSDNPFFRRVQLRDKNIWICQLTNGLPVDFVCATDPPTGRHMSFNREVNKFLLD